MATKNAIIEAINTKVGSIHSLYRIGLTHDLVERKAFWRDTEKQNVDYWASWPADSLADAQAIEAHFIYEKNMKGGVGGDLKPNKVVFVYVF